MCVMFTVTPTSQVTCIFVSLPLSSSFLNRKMNVNNIYIYVHALFILCLSSLSALLSLSLSFLPPLSLLVT